MDQTLNLNYTIIEKSDDLPSQQNRENIEILKELNLTAKKGEQVKNQICVQQIAQQVQSKKPPQEQLKQSIQIQNIIQNQNNNQQQNNNQHQNQNNNQNQNTIQNLNSVQKSKSPEQIISLISSTELNSLKKHWISYNQMNKYHQEQQLKPYKREYKKGNYKKANYRKVKQILQKMNYSRKCNNAKRKYYNNKNRILIFNFYE